MSPSPLKSVLIPRISTTATVASKKIAAIVLLAAVAVVLILGIRTLFKGDGNKKTSNKLMQLRVLLQFVAIIVLVALAYFYKN